MLAPLLVDIKIRKCMSDSIIPTVESRIGTRVAIYKINLKGVLNKTCSSYSMRVTLNRKVYI